MEKWMKELMGALDDRFGDDDTPRHFKRSPQASKKMLKDLIGNAKALDGRCLKDLEGKDFDKGLEDFTIKTLEIMSLLGHAANDIGGEFQDKMMDKVENVLSSVSDLFLGITAAKFEDGGEHTTIIKAPKDSLSGAATMTLMVGFMEDLASRLYEITDPVDLHRLVYHMCVMCAMAQAKLVARVHLKNIDTCGLMDNQQLAAVAEGDKPYCEALKGKDFLSYLAPGNVYLGTLDTRRKAERKKLDDYHHEMGMYDE